MMPKVISSLLGLALVGTSFIVPVTYASAEEAAPPAAAPQLACLQNASSDADMKAFLADPKSLLNANQVGGLPMTNSVRALAGSNPDAMNKIMALAKDANPEQKSAIAAGLARVVFECGKIGSDEANNYGASIQNAVVALGDTNFNNSFLQASNDIRTAAVNAAAGTSVGGGATENSDTRQTGENSYKSKGDGPQDTTSGDYTIGDSTPFVDDANSASQGGSTTQ